MVDRNNGNGILVEDATDVLVEGNKARYNVGDFSGWGTSGIWLDGGHDVTLRNNWLEGNVWDGLQVTDEDLHDPYGYEIYNNVVVGNWYGMRLDSVGRPGQPLNRIYGNSFVDNTVAGISLIGRSSSPLTHTSVYDNLAGRDGRRPAGRCRSTRAATPMSRSTTTSTTGRAAASRSAGATRSESPTTPTPRSVADRSFADYQALSGWDASSISADPLFVNAAAGDYHLLAGSPALDAGSPLHSAADDYDGHPRPSGAGPDIGALEGSGPCAAGACVAGTPASTALDSSVLPVKPVSVTIPSGAASATKTFVVSARNGRYVTARPARAPDAAAGRRRQLPGRHGQRRAGLPLEPARAGVVGLHGGREEAAGSGQADDRQGRLRRRQPLHLAAFG